MNNNKPGPPKEFSNILSFNLTDEQYRFIEDKARERMVALAVIVREAIYNYMDQEAKND